jgi:two-component system chemotaxis response regulator CheB
MPRIRVVVVEDSVTVRERLLEVLKADPEIEVVGFADNGRAAIELCESLRPDVITLDMMLPVMSGLAATEYIMAHRPTPILIVSSSTNRGELFKMYEALAAGAVDVLEKPNGSEADRDWNVRFTATVKLISRIRVITHPRARLGPSGSGSLTSTTVDSAASGHEGRLVAIGASTGGPGAVLEILRGLPRNFRLPILLVVHIGTAFSAAFADWLGSQSPHPVSAAQDGERLPGIGEGRVIIAPADRHLVVRAGRLRLTDEPERNFCRPSVDVLFESVARECGERTIACLLTGMGRDGAEGLLAVRRAGGKTMAQDESTSIVFGMPREAIRLGAAEQVLPLAEIAPALTSLAHATPVRRVH